ncbi:MAG: polyphenol oxidase family protein [Actinomycetota bacterium]|nr:polyphenol oxidase family protein [Actinomycetota bacterium]
MITPRLDAHTTGDLLWFADDAAVAAGILVAFTARLGGVSKPPYDTLNLAVRVGDDRADVMENRRRAGGAAGFDAGRLTLAMQVHAADIADVGPDDSGVVGEADGLFTAAPGPVLAILAADCAPVALWGTDGVAIVHAGWRGLVAGVVAKGVERVGAVHGAWIGPAIHACCYEVGPEVVAAFREAGFPVADESHVDPGRAACVALRQAGVERLVMSDLCTSCDPRFFSYRRDGVTGRHGAFVSLSSLEHRRGDASSSLEHRRGDASSRA